MDKTQIQWGNLGSQSHILNPNSLNWFSVATFCSNQIIIIVKSNYCFTALILSLGYVMAWQIWFDCVAGIDGGWYYWCVPLLQLITARWEYYEDIIKICPNIFSAPNKDKTAPDHYQMADKTGKTALNGTFIFLNCRGFVHLRHWWCG